MNTFDENKVNRVAAGTSTGGQFAAKSHPADDSVGLGSPPAPVRKRKPFKRMTRTEKVAYRKARAAELQGNLSDQVLGLANKERWEEFLRFSRSFHQYSHRNVLLIQSQYPGASRVAGFRKWKEHGRHVRRGESGIKIFGFAQRKVKDDDEETVNPASEEEEKYRTYFPIVTVFDVDQTEGDPLPEVARKLEGEDHQQLFGATEAYLEAEGWSVERERLPGGVNGFAQPEDKRIVVDESLSDAHAAKTIIHEAAHSILHSEQSLEEYHENRGLAETEAESVAYVVAGAFDMDTSDYSIGYVSGWSEFDEERLEASAKNVLKASHTLIEEISKHRASAD